MNKQLYEKENNINKPFFPVVRLEDIIDTISEKSIQWILNNYNHIYVEWKNNVVGTRLSVPTILRRNGLWITYNNGDRLITEYYIGKNTEIKDKHWQDNANWEDYTNTLMDDTIEYRHLSESLKQLFNKGNVTNFPDEEDLTSDGVALSFKDREYQPENFSGLGRVILRKNIVKVGEEYKNILTQSMLNKNNTIYIIRYDFTLNGQDIILPDNSYIEYEGGSISDGNIIDRAGGLNRVVLNKNIINGKNIITQEIVFKSNTIYEIRYDFDLNNQTIIIPENCTIKYEGGSLNNGHIVYQNTKIQGIESLNNVTTEGLFTVIDAAIDEEDLHNNNGVLKFADREYNPNAFSGLGKIILRKNIINDKNILTQDMINKENTIYEIRYDFDLNEKEITIPEGCILDFQGGRLSNGTVIGHSTAIQASLTKIFGLDLKLTGTWGTNEGFPEWFGAETNNLDCDCAIAINAITHNTPFRNIVLNNAVYYISTTIQLRGKNSFFGSKYNLEPQYNDFASSVSGACIMVSQPITAIEVIEPAQSMTIQGLLVYQRWVNRFTGVGIDFTDGRVNSCVFNNLKIAYFDIGFRVLFDKSYKGFTLNNFTNCSFVANNTGMFLATLDWSDSPRQWWMNSNHFESCKWSFNAFGGLRILGVDSFEQNLFLTCVFESNGRNLNTEGWPQRTSYYVYGVYITSAASYGYSIFDSCYFEINLPEGTNNTDNISDINENPDCETIHADIIESGAQLIIQRCTFNYGATPIVHVGNNPIKLTIRDCDFKHTAYGHYKSKSILLIKNAALAAVGEHCYIVIDNPQIDTYWEEKLINTVNVTGLTYNRLDVKTQTCKYSKDAPHNNDINYIQYALPFDTEYKVLKLSKYGQSENRPILNGYSQGIYGFVFFDTTLNKPIWWTGSKWVDATGADV